MTWRFLYHLGKANVVADALSRKKDYKVAAVLTKQRSLLEDMRRLDLEVIVRDMGVRLANLRLRPTLMDQIIEEQKESVEGKQVIEAIHSGKKKDLRLDEDGCIRYEDRLWVSPASELKKEILREAHSSPYSIHPGSTKMYKDLKKYYWWENMKRDVADF